MPRTDSQVPDFTEADLDHSYPTDARKPSNPRPPTEDIIVALEAITANTALSTASTTNSSSSLQDFPFITDEGHHELTAAQLFQNARRPSPHLSWTPDPPSQAMQSSEGERYQLLPASDPSQKHLWSDLSPVSIVPPIPTWGHPGQDLSLEKPVKPIRKSKSRKVAPPTPSRFCHICARTQKSIKVNCANLHTGKKCRKAVCQPCFEELKWDFESARKEGKWLCPHCEGICASVPRARCHIYTKTNEKRKADRTLNR